MEDPDSPDRQALADLPPLCNEVLRLQGKGYPRTCRLCGLGPCQVLVEEKTSNPQDLVAILSSLPLSSRAFAMDVAEQLSQQEVETLLTFTRRVSAFFAMIAEEEQA